MNARLARLASLSGCALLAACAAPGDFPSLAIRDAERVSGTLDVPEGGGFVPAPPQPATLARLDELADQARRAHQQFVAAVPAARRAASASRGSGPGSDNWALAQVAVANLEAIRSSAMIALADLDRIFVDAAVDGGEIERIGAARDEIAGLVETENVTISELLGMIG